MFPIYYTGNKFNETRKYLNVDYSKYKYIIEPFGGSFGFIRAIFNNCSDDCKFIINDINSDLINIYIHLRDNNTADFYKNIKKIYDKIVKKNDSKDMQIMKYLRNLKTDCLEKIYLKCLAKHAFYVGFTQKIYDKLNILKNFENNELKKLFKRCKFTCKNFNEFMDKYKNHKKTLFYLDPPYFDSNNALYFEKRKDNNCIDNTSMFCDIYHLLPFINFIFVTNKIDLFQLLFGEYAKIEYPKIYSKTKNKTMHVVYSNIDKLQNII